MGSHRRKPAGPARQGPPAGLARPSHIPRTGPTRVPKSMQPSHDDVRRIAHLARLALSEEEIVQTHAQLGSVFALIEQLTAVDTAGVEPMTHAQEMALRLRADEVAEPDRRDDYQHVAPSVERGLYLVPKVIE